MPELGDVKRGCEIGRTDCNKNKYVYSQCVDCGGFNWARLARRKDVYRCLSCTSTLNHSGKNSHWWRGGGFIVHGYKVVRIRPDNKYYSMARFNGNILEHRYIMAQHIDRPLLDSEVVHHINGNRLDNRIENLQIMNPIEHAKLGGRKKRNSIKIQREIARLNGKITELVNRRDALIASQQLGVKPLK